MAQPATYVNSAGTEVVDVQCPKGHKDKNGARGHVTYRSLGTATCGWPLGKDKWCTEILEAVDEKTAVKLQTARRAEAEKADKTAAKETKRTSTKKGKAKKAKAATKAKKTAKTATRSSAKKQQPAKAAQADAE